MRFLRFVIALLLCLALFSIAQAQDDPTTPTPEIVAATQEITEVAPVVAVTVVTPVTEEVTETAPVDEAPPVIVVQPPATPAAPSWDDVLTKLLLGIAVLGLIFSDPPKMRKGIQDAGQYVQSTKNPVDDLLFQVLKPYAEQVANVSEQLKSVQADLKTLIPTAFRETDDAKG